LARLGINIGLNSFAGRVKGKVAVSHPGASKRQKELARLERRKNKELVRLERKRQRLARPAIGINGEDPDIAGIVQDRSPCPSRRRSKRISRI